MEMPEQLNIRNIIQHNDQTNTKTGLIMLLAVPAVVFVIGLAMKGQGSYPIWVQVIIGLSILIGIGILLSVLNNKRHPEKHSAFDWPEIGTPDKVLKEIENSWNESSLDQKTQISSSHYITPDWLIMMDSSTFDAWPLREMVWAYYSVKKTYVNGVPTGTRRNINLRFITPSHFHNINVGSDEEAAELLFTFQKRSPWTFFGHTEGNHHGSHKERTSMVSAVRERHKMILTGQQVEQSDQPLQAEAIG